MRFVAAVLAVAFAVAWVIARPRFKEHEPATSVVLVTGATKGIGRSAALHLACELGFRVLAGGRAAKDLEELEAAALEAGCASGQLKGVTLDVTRDEDVASAVAEVEAMEAQGVTLAAVVNNAGAYASMPFEFTPLEESRRMMEVNFFGILRVTKALLPALRRSQGRIVSITSVAGFCGVPFMSSYSATKFAVEGSHDALRREVYPFGVHVALVQPSRITTPGLEVLDSTAKRSDDPANVYADVHYAFDQATQQRMTATTRATDIDIAHAITAARPYARYHSGLDASFAYTLSLLPDSWFDLFWATQLGTAATPTTA